MKRVWNSLLPFFVCIMCLLPVQAEDTFDTSLEASFVNTIQEKSFSTQSQEITLWKNDTGILELELEAHRDLSNVTIKEEPLEGDTGILEDAVQIQYLLPTSAGEGNGNDETTPHKDVFDIISSLTVKDMSREEKSFAWVEIHIPSSAKSGVYESNITFEAEGKECGNSLLLRVQVADRVYEEDANFTLDFWQYPHSSLRYYEALHGEEAFSDKHLQFLETQMDFYKEMGGSTITTSILDEPWNHQTYDAYPSMIAWTKNEDGSFSFDYSDWDAWVSFCLEKGIDTQIESFSILTWNNSITYMDNTTSTIVSEELEVGSEAWKNIWGQFIESYKAHVKEKGLYEITYFAMDEREADEIEQVYSLLQEHKDENGQAFKMSVYVNSNPLEHSDTWMKIDKISVSLALEPYQDSNYWEFIRERKEKGFTTYLYTCSGTYPNSFATSAQEESEWTILHAYQYGYDGYIRWSYDAWTENPRENLDYFLFEAGDTFLVYPDDFTSENPSVFSSVRLERLRQGQRDLNKLNQLESIYPEAKSAIQSLKRSYGTLNVLGAAIPSSPRASRLIALEVNRIREVVDGLSVLEENQSVPSKIKQAATKSSLCTSFGLNESWDGIYLEYGFRESYSLGSIFLMIASCVVLFLGWLRYRKPIWLVFIGIWILMGCVEENFNAPMVLYNSYTILYGILFLGIVLFYFYQRSKNRKDKQS